MNLGKEDEYQEFKEGMGQLDKGLKSLTAMLNRHGRATVYYGVNDNGFVTGLSIGKNTKMDIRNIIRNKIEPRIYADIQEECDENGRTFLKVTATGFDIPYSFDGRYYIRNVSADEMATNEMLRKMLTSSDADIIRQKESPLQNLTFNAFFAILSTNGIHPKNTTEFYSNYCLLNRDGKFNFVAYLLSDNNNISIKVITFAGLDKRVMSSRTEYGSRCLLVSASEVMKYFESINTTNVNLNGAQRDEVHLFDFASFREAWINACLHNDWNNAIPPSVYMYDDRIEVVSYGSLPFTLSKEGFFNGTSVPVNKSLLMVFMAAKFAEQSGHGIPTIVEKYGREAFSFDDGMIKVTIPLAFERQDVLIRNGRVLQKNGLTISQKKVYDALAENGEVSLEEVAEMTSLSLSGVKKICAKLQQYGLLERKGSKRNGTWEVKEAEDR